MLINGVPIFNDFRTMTWISRGHGGPCWECPELEGAFEIVGDDTEPEDPVCQIVGGTIVCEDDDGGFGQFINPVDGFDFSVLCDERYCPELDDREILLWGRGPTTIDGSLPAPWVDPNRPESRDAAGFLIKDWEWFTGYCGDDGVIVPRTANIELLVVADGADATNFLTEWLYQQLGGCSSDPCDTFTAGIYKTCNPDSFRTFCGGRIVPGSWRDVSVSVIPGANETSEDRMPRCCGAILNFTIEFSDINSYGLCISYLADTDIVGSPDGCLTGESDCCLPEDNVDLCFGRILQPQTQPPPPAALRSLCIGPPLQPHIAFGQLPQIPEGFLGIPKLNIRTTPNIGTVFGDQNNTFRNSQFYIWCQSDLAEAGINVLGLDRFFDQAICVPTVGQQTLLALPPGTLMENDPICGGSWTYSCERTQGRTDSGDASHLWTGDDICLQANKTYFVAFALDGYGLPQVDPTDTVGTINIEMQLKECL